MAGRDPEAVDQTHFMSTHPRTTDRVQAAIDAATYRQDRVREHVQDEIRRGPVHIATEGAEIGQINGLAVLQLGLAGGRSAKAVRLEQHQRQGSQGIAR